jgi:hypothetical protein
MSQVSLDIQQLLQLIYLDVYEGIGPFIQYTKGEQMLEINSVRIRAGNIPFDEEGKIQVNNEVLNDPLLAAEDAWQVEVVFGEDLPDATAGAYDLTVSELFSAGSKTPSKLFYPFSVSVLQNAGRQTTAWLRQHGIELIGQFCGLTEKAFYELSQKPGALNLIELRTKARLLEVSPPEIPSGRAGLLSLYDFSRLSESSAMLLFPSGTIDAIHLRALLNYLGLLTTCLNDSVLKRLSLEWLRRHDGI